MLHLGCLFLLSFFALADEVPLMGADPMKSSTEVEEVKRVPASEPVARTVLEEEKSAPPPEIPVPKGPTPFVLEEGRNSGSLQFGEAELSFGKDSGRAAYGIFFDTSKLPQPYRSEFGRNQILHLVLGKLVSQSLSQLGAVAFLAPKPPEKTGLVYEVLGLQALSPSKPRAVVMLTDPAFQEAVSEEARLKHTYFGLGGKVTVVPLAQAQPAVGMDALGKFEIQAYRARFDAQVGTPFSGEKPSLKGEIVFPAYRAVDAQAQTYLDEVAAKTLAHGNRSLSGTK